VILSEHTIASEVDDGRIGIDPEPDAEQYQPASLDVALGREVYDVLTDERYHVEGEMEIRPGGRYLGHTVEAIHLPNDLAAMLTGRSTLGRMFVTVHQTAGWLDPSFEGQVTLEIANFSHEVQSIEPGTRIGQVVFFQLDRPSDGYDGQYQGDTGPQPGGEL
jgi:dCTP deaminase